MDRVPGRFEGQPVAIDPAGHQVLLPEESLEFPAIHRVNGNEMIHRELMIVTVAGDEGNHIVVVSRPIIHGDERAVKFLTDDSTPGS